jgi:hypothetical protein
MLAAIREGIHGWLGQDCRGLPPACVAGVIGVTRVAVTWVPNSSAGAAGLGDSRVLPPATRPDAPVAEIAM